MTNWHLLRTNPTTFTRFLDQKKSFCPELHLYYPIYKKKTRPHGTRHPILVDSPVYPGYFFALLQNDSDDHYRISHLPTRARFIRFGDTIPVIPESVITEVKRLERLNLLVQERKIENPYRRGRKVIVHIPIADIHGIIIRLIAHARVVVDTPIGLLSVPLPAITLP